MSLNNTDNMTEMTKKSRTKKVKTEASVDVVPTEAKETKTNKTKMEEVAVEPEVTPKVKETKSKTKKTKVEEVAVEPEVTPKVKETKAKTKKTKVEEPTVEQEVTPIEVKETKAKTKKTKTEVVTIEAEVTPVEVKETKAKTKKIKAEVVTVDVTPIEVKETKAKTKKTKMEDITSDAKLVVKKSNVFGKNTKDDVVLHVGDVPVPSEQLLEVNDNYLQFKKMVTDYVDDFNKEFKELIGKFNPVTDMSNMEKTGDDLSTMYNTIDNFQIKCNQLLTDCDRIRYSIFDKLTPHLNKDQLISMYKVCLVQYANKMSRVREEFSNEVPQKVNDVARKLHELMELANENKTTKTQVYSLDSVNKSVISIDNSDNESSDTDSDKPKLQLGKSKKVTITKPTSDSD